MPLIFGLVPLTICYLAIRKARNNKYEKEDLYNEIYQNQIIKNLMKLLYDEPYSYAPIAGFPEELFKKLEIKKFNRYQSTNLISGTINQHYIFRMGNVSAILRKYRYNHREYHDTNIFNGLLIEIELKKSFNHYFYLKKKENILFKNLEDIKKEFKLKEYKINNIENEVNIYSSDEEFAERVSSKLVEYYGMIKSNKIYEIAIKENFIYLMLPNIKVPGTDVILYENRESMYQELWKEYEKFNFAFELTNSIVKILTS